MKFYIVLWFFIFTILTTSAQTNSTDFTTSLAGSADKTINYEDVLGSPYKYEEFSNAMVFLVLNEKPIEYKLNYNLYKENLEYIENDVRYTVMNPDAIVKVNINDEVLVYTHYKNYDQSKQGYFVELIDDYISLYKREFVSYLHSQKTFNN